MEQQTFSLLDQILSFPVVARTRRNHGLEHATLHVLSRRFPGIPLGGHSSAQGFRIIGNVSTETLQEAVEEALARLKAGERQLAVHPNCGTNFATAGTLAGLAGAFAMLGVGRRFWDKVERLSLAMTLGTLMLIISQPLGAALQKRVTTSGQVDDLKIKEILCLQRGRITIHQVTTQG